MTKNELIALIETAKATSGYGLHLNNKHGYQQCADLDGKHARQYLEAMGFEVVDSGDKGNRGFALTACGIDLSTNGYIHRV